MLLVSFMDVVQWLTWIVLVLTLLVLVGVILLQEGKGGGLAEAFGGAGAETFGVKAHGINKFTAILGVVFLTLCILLNKFDRTATAEVLDPTHKPPPPAGAPGFPPGVPGAGGAGGGAGDPGGGGPEGG